MKGIELGDKGEVVVAPRFVMPQLMSTTCTYTPWAAAIRSRVGSTDSMKYYHSFMQPSNGLDKKLFSLKFFFTFPIIASILL